MISHLGRQKDKNDEDGDKYTLRQEDYVGWDHNAEKALLDLMKR